MHYATDQYHLYQQSVANKFEQILLLFPVFFFFYHFLSVYLLGLEQALIHLLSYIRNMFSMLFINQPECYGRYIIGDLNQINIITKLFWNYC